MMFKNKFAIKNTPRIPKNDDFLQILAKSVCCKFVILHKTVDFLQLIVYNTTTALGGELAVPCNSQSAIARLKGYGRFLVWKAGPCKEC